MKKQENKKKQEKNKNNEERMLNRKKRTEKKRTTTKKGGFERPCMLLRFKKNRKKPHCTLHQEKEKNIAGVTTPPTHTNKYSRKTHPRTNYGHYCFKLMIK